MTALGALLLALGKRRAELKSAGEGATKQRSILAEYTTEFIDALIMSTATLAIFTYALYAIDLGDTGGECARRQHNDDYDTVRGVWDLSLSLPALCAWRRGNARDHSFEGSPDADKHSFYGLESHLRYSYYTRLTPLTAVDAS